MSKIHVSLSDGATLFPNWAYQAVFDGYDGQPSEPVGRGATEEEAIADLIEQAAEG